MRSALCAGSLMASLLAGCEQAKKPEQTAAESGSAASNPATESTPIMPTSASFGKTSDGTEVQLFTLTNAHGLQATISTYGAS
ncbi:hypothetical protein [Hymenobacter cellulosilyticus]|uniref:Galactose-1-epimerase n=1 Tax=Hymenobacter cellulosilyticus TaxID=2932248 RepID=A0A8T9QCT0_9BACT|nr:hypothetical protein MUN79_10045 [Hymenobacter cellulosilyticus]